MYNDYYVSVNGRQYRIRFEQAYQFPSIYENIDGLWVLSEEVDVTLALGEEWNDTEMWERQYRWAIACRNSKGDDR